MGRDISTSAFTEEDFQAFSQRLHAETELLASWFADKRLAEAHPVGGFELEAWLIDADGRPTALNERLLETLQDPLLTHELAQFNIELNTAPRTLTAPARGRQRWGRN